MTENKQYRLEDERFLTGAGRYVEDLPAEGFLHAAFVRSPVAHGRIEAVDTTMAAEAPGVAKVLTGADLLAEGLKPMRTPLPMESFDGAPFFEPERHALAVEEVRFVGEPVALVLAETEAQAEDAAEMVTFDYREESACIDPAASAEVAFAWKLGDEQQVNRRSAEAAHKVSIKVANNRVLAAPLENRAALAAYDPANDTYMLQTQSQGVHFMRKLIAPALDVAPERIRVVTPDVGGSFGMKLAAYPEQVAVLAAARIAGRPVRWAASRSEGMLADAHARDHVSEATLSLDEGGRFLALEIETYGNLGAYCSAFAAPTVSAAFAKTAGSVYRIPALSLTARGVYTHTAPTEAYRGAGKPESVFLMERLVDRAAAEVGVDPVELRRRNLVPAEEMPYTAATGIVWRDADMPGALERLLAESDHAGFAARRAESESRGMRRGYGVGMYLHISGGSPDDTAVATLESDGRVAIRTGSQNIGEGQETAFAQVAAERLGIPADRIRILQGDTAEVPERGNPTGGSSALQIGAVSILRAAGAMVDALKPQAAEALEAAAADLDYGGGAFTVAGTDMRVTLADLAARMAPAELRACAGTADFEGDHVSVPNGAYACEVEVDPETGHVAICAFTGVDDIGRRLNPALAEGQLQGGIAQGIGATVMERAIYDEGGQLITGSWMDYAMPRADDMPAFALHDAGIPNVRNPLGAKGAGEPGAIGAPAAVINAVADAVGREVAMPATPQAVWRALRASA